MVIITQEENKHWTVLYKGEKKGGEEWQSEKSEKVGSMEGLLRWRQRIKEELGQLKSDRVGLAEYLLHKREREKRTCWFDETSSTVNVCTVENSGRVGLMEYLA